MPDDVRLDSSPSSAVGATNARDSLPIQASLLALVVALEAYANVSDELVKAHEEAADHDRLTDLLDSFYRARAEVARANPAAAGCVMPEGQLGAGLVMHMKACNARVRAGVTTAEKILSLRQTVDLFGERLVVQAISNLASIAAWPSALRLRDAFRGRPAVVVAAGPSLDKNIETVRRFKGKGLILSVSHAALALHRAGIAPDLCIATDPQDLRYHFANLPVETYGALILGAAVLPELFELPAPRCFTFAANNMVDSWVYEGIEKEFLVSSAGSVATDAFSMAVAFGCDPVILVGVDLSFPDGRFYAASLPDGDARIALSGDGRSGIVRDVSPELRKLGGEAPVLMREVPGYYGGRVPTSFVFHKACVWFGDTARALADGHTLLNCTEGGAYIDGMEHVPLAEAAARYAGEDVAVEAVLDGVIDGIDREARRLLTLERVDAMLAALSACTTLARRCGDLAERAKRNTALSKKLTRAEEELSRTLDSLSFVSTMVQREIRAAMWAGKEARSAAEGLDASLQVYAAVLRVTSTIREPLLRARRTLEQPWCHLAAQVKTETTETAATSTGPGPNQEAPGPER